MDGKVDWMAAGLPVEGDDGPFVGEAVAAVATCDVRGTVADARRALGEAGTDRVVLVYEDGFAVGEVDRADLDAAPAEAALADVLRPVPTTVRPSAEVAAVAADGGGTVLVTTSDGRLLGAARVDGRDGPQPDHDEHGDHDHGDRGQDPPGIDVERFEAELDAVTAAVEEHFGGREPSEEELRAFLVERLVAEGRPRDEADRIVRATAGRD